MARCDIHIWNTTDTQPCWKCEELKYSERLKFTNMANQHYKVITNSTIELNGKPYTAATWNMNLEEFLNKNAGKEIFIVESSLSTNNISAIVLKRVL